MNILAIDLGSTQFKFGLFDGEARLLRQCSMPVGYCGSSFDRLPMKETLVAWQNGVSELCQNCTPDAISISSQAQTFTLLDADGSARHFHSWRRVSPDEIIAEARMHFAKLDFAGNVSFCEPCQGMALVILKELRKNNELPEAFGHLAFLPEYLHFLLTGIYAIDENQAAMTGLFSRIKRTWWQPALEWLGLSQAKLGRTVPAGSISARTMEGNIFGLKCGIPVILAGNDQTAGAFGADVQPGQVFISLGTAFAAYAVLSKPATIPGGASGEYYDKGFYALKTASLGGGDLSALVQKASGGDYGRFFSSDFQEMPEFRKIITGLAETVYALNPRATDVIVAGGASKSGQFLEALRIGLGLPLRKCDASPMLGGARLALRAIDGN